MTEIHYRLLEGIAEFKEAEALQRAVWGEGDKEDPFDLMMVIQKEGGLVAGAFREGRLLGYVFGFPTRDPEIQYSHRLAVLPEARGLGLGLGLKRYQRLWCLENRIRAVHWTFDPLRLANAVLNIRALGARSSTYHRDYYGEMEGINRGAPSDRLRVDWRLDDPLVERRATGDRDAADLGDVSTREIVIPADFDRLLAHEPEQAIALPGNARALRRRLRGRLRDP
jgi:predicted GNAT superfamily acetyltransferase